jgi:hypothetical protein
MPTETTLVAFRHSIPAANIRTKDERAVKHIDHGSGAMKPFGMPMTGSKVRLSDVLMITQIKEQQVKEQRSAENILDNAFGTRTVNDVVQTAGFIIATVYARLVPRLWVLLVD